MITQLLYIDPGTGSLLFQALLSGFFTILLFFKKIKMYILYKFKKKDDSKSDA